MMKLKKLLNCIYPIIITITLGLSCEKISYPKSSVGVANKSNHDIHFYFALGGGKGIIYPDTVLPTSLTPPFLIAKMGETGYRDFGFSEEEIFEAIPSDTLSIYIFHPDTLAKYNWERVVEDYKILKRYDVSYGDLKRLSFTVTYPPDASMKGVKMYPE